MILIWSTASTGYTFQILVTCHRHFALIVGPRSTVSLFFLLRNAGFFLSILLDSIHRGPASTPKTPRFNTGEKSLKETKKNSNNPIADQTPEVLLTQPEENDKKNLKTQGKPQRADAREDNTRASMTDWVIDKELMRKGERFVQAASAVGMGSGILVTCSPARITRWPDPSRT